MIPNKYSDIYVCEHDPSYAPFEVWTDMDQMEVHDVISSVRGVAGVDYHPCIPNNVYLVFWDRRFNQGEVIAAVKQALRESEDG